MSYFRASRGWQSGFANMDATDPRLMNVVEPEKLLSFEVGSKSQWWNNRVRLNADMYYSDYSDQVVNTFVASPSGGPQAIIQNAGKSQFWGAELEATVIPLRGVMIDANYSYSNAMYTEFLSDAFDDQGKLITGVKTNVAGQRPVTLNPDHKFGVGVSYTAPPFSFGTLSGRIDAVWQNDQEVFTVALPLNAGVRNIHAGNYAVVNGRVQLAEIPLQKGSLDISAFGKNLLDRKYRTYGIDFGDSLGFTGATYGDPRTFGLQLTYNFTAS